MSQTQVIVSAGRVTQSSALAAKALANCMDHSSVRPAEFNKMHGRQPQQGFAHSIDWPAVRKWAKDWRTGIEAKQVVVN